MIILVISTLLNILNYYYFYYIYIYSYYYYNTFIVVTFIIISDVCFMTVADMVDESIPSRSWTAWWLFLFVSPFTVEFWQCFPREEVLMWSPLFAKLLCSQHWYQSDQWDDFNSYVAHVLYKVNNHQSIEKIIWVTSTKFRGC